jgi:hypothetical protein
LPLCTQLDGNLRFQLSGTVDVDNNLTLGGLGYCKSSCWRSPHCWKVNIERPRKSIKSSYAQPNEKSMRQIWLGSLSYRRPIRKSTSNRTNKRMSPSPSACPDLKHTFIHLHPTTSICTHLPIGTNEIYVAMLVKHSFASKSRYPHSS